MHRGLEIEQNSGYSGVFFYLNRSFKTESMQKWVTDNYDKIIESKFVLFKLFKFVLDKN